jgi:Zn-dependent protease with chaperone function
MAYTYPVAPAHVPESATRPSPEFKSEVIKVLSSILLFIVAYIVLVVAAVLLAIAAGYGGIMLMAFYINVITIMLGIGMVGLGLMVIYFLLKFIFKTSKTDRSHLIEVNRKDQPVLFEFVKRLTHEVKAPFPKKIYLSADVNASVFYDSGFWSMFLPVRKNLQIGLGLVNAMNMSEFKAVLAHEFGHFSQRSMKLGSYVYNVNRVIHNMLFDNTGYQQTLESWGNMNNYFALFAGLTSGIVMGIQAILKQLYSIINKSYYSLSRQMEFHADAVAASVAGGNHLTNALRRLEMADACQQDLFGFCNRLVSDNQRIANLFPHHLMVMQMAARDLKLECKEGLPQIDRATVHRLANSRVIVKDQWASHPSTDERDDHLTRLNLTTPANHESAWAIFENREQLQQQATNLLYSSVTFKSNPTTLSDAEIKERYERDVQKFDFPALYKGFYDSRGVMELKEIPTTSSQKSVDAILTADVVQSPKRIQVFNIDINMLEAIQRPKSGVKTFDFDGKRCSIEDAPEITATLKADLTNLEEQANSAERELIALAFKQAGERGLTSELQEKYKVAHITDQDFQKCAAQYFDIMGILQPVFGQVSVGQALAIDNQLKLNEKKIKEEMSSFLQNPKLLNWCTHYEADKIKTYVNEKLNYFSENRGFDNDAIALFQDAHSLFYQTISKRMFQAKKDLLDWQAENCLQD